jgi:hypothetical protein
MGRRAWGGGHGAAGKAGTTGPLYPIEGTVRSVALKAAPELDEHLGADDRLQLLG